MAAKERKIWQEEKGACLYNNSAVDVIKQKAL